MTRRCATHNHESVVECAILIVKCILENAEKRNDQLCTSSFSVDSSSSFGDLLVSSLSVPLNSSLGCALVKVDSVCASSWFSAGITRVVSFVSLSTTGGTGSAWFSTELSFWGTSAPFVATVAGFSGAGGTLASDVLAGAGEVGLDP